jgi:bacterioferritin
MRPMRAHHQDHHRRGAGGLCQGLLLRLPAQRERNASARPWRIGQNVKEIIECDLTAEVGARTLYQEAATYCHSVRDYVSRDLFESLMKDEEHHIDFLETQLDLIGRIGLELYTQKHVGGLAGEE